MLNESSAFCLRQKRNPEPDLGWRQRSDDEEVLFFSFFFFFFFLFLPFYFLIFAQPRSSRNNRTTGPLFRNAPECGSIRPTIGNWKKKEKTPTWNEKWTKNRIWPKKKGRFFLLSGSLFCLLFFSRISCVMMAGMRTSVLVTSRRRWVTTAAGRPSVVP